VATLTLERESLEELIAGDSVDDFTYVITEYDGEWRWGSEHTLIFKDSVGNYWAYPYREQSGDNYWCSLNDEDDLVTVEQVYPVEVKTIAYRSAPAVLPEVPED
jgi:hypothetical protein